MRYEMKSLEMFPSARFCIVAVRLKFGRGHMLTLYLFDAQASPSQCLQNRQLNMQRIVLDCPRSIHDVSIWNVADQPFLDQFGLPSPFKAQQVPTFSPSHQS